MPFSSLIPKSPECKKLFLSRDVYKRQYLNKNDFVVGLSCFEEKDDYGKYYHLDIFIKNLSETPIVFQPDSVPVSYIHLDVYKRQI